MSNFFSKIEDIPPFTKGILKKYITLFLIYFIVIYYATGYFGFNLDYRNYSLIIFVLYTALYMRFIYIFINYISIYILSRIKPLWLILINIFVTAILCYNFKIGNIGTVYYSILFLMFTLNLHVIFSYFNKYLENSWNFKNLYILVIISLLYSFLCFPNILNYYLRYYNVVSSSNLMPRMFLDMFAMGMNFITYKIPIKSLMYNYDKMSLVALYVYTTLLTLIFFKAIYFIRIFVYYHYDIYMNSKKISRIIYVIVAVLLATIFMKELNNHNIDVYLIYVLLITSMVFISLYTPPKYILILLGIVVFVQFVIIVIIVTILAFAAIVGSMFGLGRDDN